MSEVADKVKAIIVDKLGVDESEVTETASDTVELIMEFEKAFNITIPDEAASEKISTVGDAISYIENELKK